MSRYLSAALASNRKGRFCKLLRGYPLNEGLD